MSPAPVPWQPTNGGHAKDKATEDWKPFFMDPISVPPGRSGFSGTTTTNSLNNGNGSSHHNHHHPPHYINYSAQIDCQHRVRNWPTNGNQEVDGDGDGAGAGDGDGHQIISKFQPKSAWSTVDVNADQVDASKSQKRDLYQ